jgi:hypothetical protein
MLDTQEGTAMHAVITTWIDGSLSKGNMGLRFVYGTLAADGQALQLSQAKYSTASGARKAAVRAGHTPVKGVAQGHANAFTYLRRFLVLE